MDSVAKHLTAFVPVTPFPEFNAYMARHSRSRHQGQDIRSSFTPRLRAAIAAWSSISTLASSPRSASAVTSFFVAGPTMTEQQLAQFRRYEYQPSRIPALDAISTFVPTGQEKEPVIKAALARKGYSRWFPVAGGHRLLILHEGEPFDTARLTLEKRAWDHEHCNSCRTRIPSMTLCWVSVSGPDTILCEECHSQVSGDA